MEPIRYLVLDVMKPHEPSTLALARDVASCDGVHSADAELLETDREVENVELTVDGDALDFEAIEETVEHLGGSVHSIDRVVCGDRPDDPAAD